jgi:uncharacterized membrane protein YhfC
LQIFYKSNRKEYNDEEFLIVKGVDVMEFSGLIVSFIINLIICFGIPIGFLIYLIAARRDGIKPFFIGMLVFFVSQVLLRIPLIQYFLPKLDWYSTFQAFYPIIYCIFLGLTAGIFEEVGRFLGFKLGLKKKRSWFHGLAFGMGHAGIEAMLLVGVSNLTNLVMLISLNNGSYNSSTFGMSEEKIRTLLSATTSINVLVGGIERIFTILIHIGLTFIVLYGINKRKNIFLGLAILIHGIIDSVAAISMNMGFNMYLIEAWCAVCAIILTVFSIKIRKDFKGDVRGNEEII